MGIKGFLRYTARDQRQITEISLVLRAVIYSKKVNFVPELFLILLTNSSSPFICI